MTTEGSEYSELLDKLDLATDLLRRSGGEVPGAVERFVDGLDVDLHADAPSRLDGDPYLSTALFAAALRSVKALRHDDASIRYRDLRIALEQVRHALRDIVDNAPFGDDQPVSEIADRLAETVQVPQAELAEVLGISTRQLQRWLSGAAEPTGHDAARLRIVAQIANQLRHAFTAPGVVRWFGRENPRLGVAPVVLLDDPARYPELTAVARAARTTVG